MSKRLREMYAEIDILTIPMTGEHDQKDWDNIIKFNKMLNTVRNKVRELMSLNK